MSYIQIRIDDELKESAINLFNDLGLDLSTAIRLFLKRSVDDKKLPFKLDSKKHDSSNDIKYRLRADVMVPFNTDPFMLMDEFIKVCKENDWYCLGGGVQFPHKSLTLSKPDDGIYYFGSPYKIDYLKENCDFTPYKEIAIAFGSKPSNLFTSDGRLYFDPNTYPVYLYQVDEPITFDIDFINHPNSLFEKGMEFRSTRCLKLKLIDVINE